MREAREEILLSISLSWIRTNIKSAGFPEISRRTNFPNRQRSLANQASWKTHYPVSDWISVTLKVERGWSVRRAVRMMQRVEKMCLYIGSDELKFTRRRNCREKQSSLSSSIALARERKYSLHVIQHTYIISCISWFQSRLTFILEILFILLL